MRDTELYRQLLGLASPWTVTRVELAVKEQRVDVWAGHAEGERWPCPECGALLPLYDHTEEREWRHLDSCQFKTYLHARPPRIQWRARGAAGAVAVGRGVGAVHDAVRAVGDRCAPGNGRARRRADSGDHVGRGLAYPRAGCAPRPAGQGAAGGDAGGRR